MGERICLRFCDSREVSPVLYSHWDGPHLVSEALRFVSSLDYYEFRTEPSNVMVNFILYHCKKMQDGEYYLSSMEDACEPDWGFWEVDTQLCQAREIDGQGRALTEWGIIPTF